MRDILHFCGGMLFICGILLLREFALKNKRTEKVEL